MNERPDAVCATCGTDEKALYSQVAQVIQQYKDKEGSLISMLPRRFLVIFPCSYRSLSLMVWICLYQRSAVW